MIMENSLVCLTLVDEILHVELHLLSMCNLPNMKYTIYLNIINTMIILNIHCQSIHCFCKIILQKS